MNRDGSYGGAHLNKTDADTLVDRLARSVAESFAQYALPNSPLAGGNIDNLGPQVTGAAVTSNQPNQLLLTVTHDAASGFRTLDPDAAAGLGWSLVTPGGLVAATAVKAAVQDGSHLALTFANAFRRRSSRVYYTMATVRACGFGALVARATPNYATKLGRWTSPSG
jgi:hypothetical protein